jgi:hypothetical protein
MNFRVAFLFWLSKGFCVGVDVDSLPYWSGIRNMGMGRIAGVTTAPG